MICMPPVTPLSRPGRRAESAFRANSTPTMVPTTVVVMTASATSMLSSG
jgi:hypothetical protein